MKSGKSKRSFRLLIQIAATALQNGYARGFLSGKIFTGKTKYFCVPGMNCYSCPLAFCACPIGALQATLNSRKFSLSLYAAGIIFVFGAIFGRIVCGFLCPFGLLQDLLFKIPFFKKIREIRGEKIARFFRFFILALFAIILPMFVCDITGLGEPWFCKFLCPVGTLEAGIPLVLLNKSLRGAIGFLFKWKAAILTLTIIASLAVFRPFCRWICPLGAIYGVFNKFALKRMSIDAEKCVKCGKCQQTCKLGIKVWENPNSADCIRCGECVNACPESAIKFG